MIVVAKDGTGDFTTVGAALGAVPPGGAEVFVKRGTYSEANLFVPSNTTLRGEGEASVIVLPNGANTNLVVCVNAHDVTVADLRIDGNRANQTGLGNGIYMGSSARIRIVNTHVVGANGYNIVCFPGCTDVVIAENISESAFSEGIEVQGSSRVTVADNVVINAGTNGIVVWAISAQNGTCNDVTVVGNVVDGYSKRVPGYAGVRVDDGSQDVTVSGNSVRNGGQASNGITVGSDASAPVSSVTVAGNTVDSSTGFGIQALRGSVMSIVGNEVRATAAPYDAIRIESSAAGVVVMGNVIQGAGAYGIHDRGAHDVVISGNLVKGAGFSGVLVYTGSDQFEVSANVIDGVNREGIVVTNSANGVISGNTLSGNGAAGFAGISLDTTTCVVITSNTVATSGADGILVGDGAKAVTVTANVCSSQGWNGIHVRNASDVSVSANVCRANGRSRIVGATNGICVEDTNSTTKNVILNANRCFDDQASRTQAYGIRTLGAVDNLLLVGNALNGNQTTGLGVGGAETNLNAVPYRKLAVTVGAAQTAVAHGLGYPPLVMSIMPTSAGQVWRSAPSDATNVYLSADQANRTAELLVG